MGIGVRVASQILRDRAAASQAASAGAAPSGTSPLSASAVAQTAFETGRAVRPVSGSAKADVAEKRRNAAQKTRNVGRASRQFGEAIWGPFARVSGVLWLEVTGLFFGIFALFFAQNVYRLRHQFTSGQEHAKLLIYATLAVVFVYFTFTSFYRARRKSRRT